VTTKSTKVVTTKSTKVVTTKSTKVVTTKSTKVVTTNDYERLRTTGYYETVTNWKRHKNMYEYRKLTPEQRQQLVEERQAKGYPPHQPPHPLQEENYYLLTAVCYEHQHH